MPLGRRACFARRGALCDPARARSSPVTPPGAFEQGLRPLPSGDATTGDAQPVEAGSGFRRPKPRYLLRLTRSAAYSLLDDDVAAEHGWDYGCDYEVIEKFEHPLTLEEMKSDPALREWGALRARFRRKVYEIPPDTWNHLLDRLSVDRDASERRRRRAAKRYALERDIEDRLARDLRPFRKHGFNLELRARQHVLRRGGRADLVCYDRDANRYVIIELKRGLASRNAVAQLLSYRASINEEFPARSPPIGILVGDRLDNEASGIIEDDERLLFVALDEIR